ncbi:hypothetical protein BaRGS_00037835 [Batillaria attramentaria]|uniref:Uncharacterized protein n=1 Tax=Batillaria attramentaria TaxID=370345 RepID=A0ABD0J7G9_9CAEN
MICTVFGPLQVELIEKEEQRQVKRVETAMDRWNSSRKPPQKKRPHLKKNAGPTGKPPVDPKSKFSRFRSNFQTSNAVGDQATKPTAPAQQDKTDSTVSEETTKPAVPALAVKMGPPSISLASRPTAGQKVQDRPASDQGARATAAPARPASDGQKVRPSPAGTSSGDSLPLASGQCRGSDSQKVCPSPAGTSSGDSLPLASGQCRGSDGQKEHPAPSAGTAELLSAAASKTERPNSDTPKTRQSGAPPASDKLSNTKSQSLPQSKGPSTSGPGFPIKQPVKVHVKKTSTDDSKQAWDG